MIVMKEGRGKGGREGKREEGEVKRGGRTSIVWIRSKYWGREHIKMIRVNHIEYMAVLKMKAS